jgi:transcriptional regulator with XRE-family HTH domain
MINEALRLVRLAHGYKSKEVAEKLGVSASYLSEIENGKKTPTLDLLQKYSGFFDIRLSTLMFFTEELDRERPKEKIKDNVRKYIFKLMQLIEKQKDVIVDEEGSGKTS